MRYSLGKVLLTVPPFHPSFYPALCVFSHPALPSPSNFRASYANLCYSIACALLISLAALFRARSLCFQWVADSLPKTPGVGVQTFFQFVSGTRGDRGGLCTTLMHSQVFQNQYLQKYMKTNDFNQLWNEHLRETGGRGQSDASEGDPPQSVAAGGERNSRGRLLLL